MHTLRLRRPLFCCCCCSMSSMAEAGGEAALMALTTLMLSSGSGGRLRRSRPRTFISWSSSKPPKVNWTQTGRCSQNATRAKMQKNHRNRFTCIMCQCGCNVQTSIVFQSSRSTFFMGKCGAFMLQNLVTMVKRSRVKGSPLYKGEPEGSRVKASVFGLVKWIHGFVFVYYTKMWL